MTIRQPIVAVLGHVDHGKTSLLDRIRGSTVADKEAGAITQHAGASEVPAETIRKTAGKLLDELKINLTIPGLLMLDTPGHEAFTTIRKRGSSIADLAILVVDINQGFQPQTDEALNFLKEFKTPFLVAATKIDILRGWKSNKDTSFKESFEKQPEHVKEYVEGEIYKIVGALSERGFESERFDRVKDFKKTVAIVPVSSLTGEGFPELLVMLSGLAQTFLKDQLEVTEGQGRGSIMEVKEVKGLGITADVILYDGEISKGDLLVVGGREPVVIKMRGLLKPKPLKEIRVEKNFENVDKVTAACGVKIFAPDLDKIIPGSPFIAVKNEKDVAAAKKELAADIESLEFSTTRDGVLVRADTLGSLEAAVHIITAKGIDVRKAEVGTPTRKDVTEQDNVKNGLKRVILLFNVNVPSDVEQEARDKKIKIIKSDVIYKIFEEYETFVADEKEKMRMAKLASITMPGKFRILPGFVFRANDPAVVGIEVLAGELKPGVKLLKAGKDVGTVKDIQQENKHTDKAEKGNRYALSISGPTVGRQIKEGDELCVKVSERDIKALEELGMHEEARLARETLDA